MGKGERIRNRNWYGEEEFGYDSDIGRGRNWAREGKKA